MAKDNYTKFDFAQVLKKSLQEQVDALRFVNVQNLIDTYYSRAIAFYDANNSVNRVKFYLDKTRQQSKIEVTFNNVLDINGKYFLLNSGGNRKRYIIHFTNGVPTPPSLLGYTTINVPISAGESQNQVAANLAVELLMTKEFEVSPLNNTSFLTLTNIDKGLTDNITDVNTGFNLTTIIAGITDLIKDCEIEPIPDTRIVFNELEKRFELFNIQPISVQLETTATDSEIEEISITTANIEQALVIPDNTKKIFLQVREPNTKLYIATSLGGPKRTIRYGCSYMDSDVSYIGKTLYISTDKDNRTIELQLWS